MCGWMQQAPGRPSFCSAPPAFCSGAWLLTLSYQKSHTLLLMRCASPDFCLSDTTCSESSGSRWSLKDTDTIHSWPPLHALCLLTLFLKHKCCLCVRSWGWLQVHERTLQGDFLMALLKDILAARRAAGRPLKVHLPVHCVALW